MKKYTSAPIPNGGMPIYAGEMIPCFQEEIYRAILAPYLAYGEPVIINGCQVVPNTMAGTCTISAGMAVIDGDMIDVPAYAGAYPVYLHQGVAATVTKAYKDQNPRVVTIEKTCAYSLVAPGAGETILFDPYTSQYLRDVKRRYETPVNMLIPFVDYPNGSSAAFDAVTGIGKWEWLGFRIPPELTGRVLVQFDPADPDFAIGNPFGEKDHTLTKAQLAKHRHLTLKSGMVNNSPGSNTPTNSSSVSAGGDLGGNPLAYELHAGSGNADVGLSSEEGGDQPHNNTQKSLSGLYVKRI